MPPLTLDTMPREIYGYCTGTVDSSGDKSSLCKKTERGIGLLAS